jgi:peroxiredoxin Q/BCP
MMKTLNSKDKAPHFDLKDQNGLNVRLSDFAGKKLFLYFYPKANTSG